MSKTIAVIHTTAVTVEPLGKLISRAIPGVKIINIVDDSLLADVREAGGVTKEVSRRMLAYYDFAAQKADLILNACSSVGEVVDMLRQLISVPIVRIDEPMAEQAVDLGVSVAVLATVQTTLDPTVRLIERTAVEKGKNVKVSGTLVSGAFEAVVDGNPEEHDRLILEKVIEAALTANVIVLAQASMARAISKLDENFKVPVLTSPESGVNRAKEILTSV